VAGRLTTVREDATPTQEGVPSPSPLEPPEWLSDDAQTIWRTLAPHVPDGRLNPGSADLFAMYVNSLAQYREADGIIQDAGMLIALGQDLAPNPALPIRTQADATAARWAKTFGLSPDSQTAAPPPGKGRRQLPHLVE
jgi:P27 family predicted phage terminase small subunit